tara:strand:- start:1582 stop:1770 length:189 start_codon:yes stop_codon:yes gene_type:complete
MKVDYYKEYEDEVHIDIGRVHIRVIRDKGQQDVFIYDNLEDEDGDYVDEDYKTSWTFEEERE